MKNTRVLLILVALVALAAVSCGNDSAADDGAADTAVDDAATDDAATDDAATDDGAADDAAGDDSAADDAAADDSAADDAASDDAASDGGSGDDGASPTPSGGESMVTVGGETIALPSVRCFLEEQDAAAGGGKILLTAQASGVNAAGEDVLVDFSRYDEDSQFVGDDVSIDIGDPFSDDLVSYFGVNPIGTVSVDGNVVSATDFAMTGTDPVSFVLSC